MHSFANIKEMLFKLYTRLLFLIRVLIKNTAKYLQHFVYNTAIKSISYIYICCKYDVVLRKYV